MKLLLLFLAASAALGAQWDGMQGIPTGRKIEIATRDGKRTRADFLPVAGNVLAFRETSGERSLTRPEIHGAAKPQAFSDQLSAVSFWMRAVSIRLISTAYAVSSS